MRDNVIQLLPDSIADQIAAGEVVQRPASAVKELMENAIDAGSTKVQVIIKDAGRSLIQIVDNGKGMSDTDARLSFERHATSKIRKAEDLFAIDTFGFRGEALASIAAVARVELKTRQKGEDIGTQINIEGSEVKSQEACQCAEGTSIAVKDLFYNIPVRRNFLKSNAVETRHIVDEFLRIALANPATYFTLHNNGVEVYHLPAAPLRKRVVQAFGKTFNERLVPVEVSADFLRIYGFVGKPEFARRTRGEQFFFVNERFIKSGYLNKAVMNAYEELLPQKTYPLYVIFMDIDPTRIDVNVHPTKQEIKFDDERVVFRFLEAAVKRALGAHSVTPTLDFDNDVNITIPGFSGFGQMGASRGGSPSSNPKKTGGGSGSSGGASGSDQRNKAKQVPKGWENLYKTADIDFPKEEQSVDGSEIIVDPETGEILPAIAANNPTTITVQSEINRKSVDPPSLGKIEQENNHRPFQLHERYILTPIRSGFILLDQQSAHERILFEQYQKNLEQAAVSTQQLLFPQTIELPSADARLLKEVLSDINALGYDLQEFGQNTFVLHGIPSDLANSGSNGEEEAHIEQLLEQYKSQLGELKLDKRTHIARAMARSHSIKKGQKLSEIEMRELIDRLFACEQPYYAPDGKPTLVTYGMEDIEARFT